MIAVAIIGLLLGVAMSSFARARRESRTRVCQARLREIDGAIARALMDATNVPALMSDPGALEGLIVPAYLRHMPRCPVDGAAYVLTNATVICPNAGNPACPWHSAAHVE
ncbi:hypothetical protein GX586_03210 [bacterium]|nr:hypothetical protein [bacterium]